MEDIEELKMEVQIPAEFEAYHGWKIFEGPDHPVTGKWRADKFGVQICAGTRSQIRRMVERKAKEEQVDKIRRYYLNNPFAQHKIAAEALGFSTSTVRKEHVKLQNKKEVEPWPKTGIPYADLTHARR